MVKPHWASRYDYPLAEFLLEWGQLFVVRDTSTSSKHRERLVLHLYLDLLSVLLGTPDLLLKPAKCGLPLCHSVLHILVCSSLITDYFTWIKKSMTSFISSPSVNLTLSLPLKLTLRTSIIFLLIHKPILLAVFKLDDFPLHLFCNTKDERNITCKINIFWLLYHLQT